MQAYGVSIPVKKFSELFLIEPNGIGLKPNLYNYFVVIWRKYFNLIFHYLIFMLIVAETVLIPPLATFSLLTT